MRGLNIGCGKDYRQTLEDGIEWVNVDADPSIKSDLLSAAEVLTYHWLGFFNEIVAIDILEHIRHWHLALRQWCDMLKPGGTIHIQVPALAQISARYLSGDITYETANRVIYGECTSDWDRHWHLFNYEMLEKAFEDFGLTVIEKRPLHVNIVVRARKP